MKWLFAFLLLLNIGMFMWGSWYRAVPVGTLQELRPPLNAEKMRPLPVKPSRPPEPPAPPVDDRAAAQANVACVSVGPFALAVQAQAASDKLKQLGLDHRQREHIEKTVASYRVFLPSLASRRAAEDKRKQLTRLGFKDHYIIEEPGKENEISLGVFAVKRNASVQARQLAEKGIRARQETVYNMVTVYWFDLKLARDEVAKLRKLDWRDPKVGLQERPCVKAPTKSVGEPRGTPPSPR